MFLKIRRLKNCNLKKNSFSDFCAMQHLKYMKFFYSRQTPAFLSYAKFFKLYYLEIEIDGGHLM